MSETGTPSYPWLMERRYLALILVVAFVILSAVAFNICYRHHTINTEQVLKEDRSAANLFSLLLDEHFKKIVSVMEAYIHRPLLLQAVRNKNTEKALIHLISLTKSDPDIDILVISDRWGALWAAYPERPEVLGKNLAYRDWYRGVSKEWKPYISDVVQRIVAEKDSAIQISIPMFDEAGEVIGILVNTQRAVGLRDLFEQTSLDPGQDITVTDRKGQIVYSSRRDLEKEQRPYPFHSGIQKAMAAKDRTFAVDDPDLGGARYISFSPVANLGWNVFVERDKRSVFLSEIAYYIQVTAIGFLLFLSIIFFLVYLRKQVMAQQIRQELDAEKKLRAGEERHKSYVDIIMQLAWTTNDKGEIVEDNPSWSKYTGRGYEAYKGFGWIEDIHPDDRERTGQIWGKAVAEKSFYETEYRVRRYDGVYRDYLARGIPLLDKNGSVREWVGTCIDITERKRAEKERALNSQRIQAQLQLNQMTDATLIEITDFALEEAVRLTQSTIGYLAFLNEDESVLTMHSWSKSAMAECAIIDKPIIYPVVTTGLWGEAVRQRRPVFTNDYGTANPLKKGYPEGHVAVKRHMNVPVFDGTRIVIVAGVGNKAEEYNESDAKQLLLLMEGMWRLTERKRAEEALQESEEKYRDLFDKAMEGVYQTTPEGRLISANMALARMFGYESPEEMINAITDLASQMYANQDDRKIAVGIFKEKGYIKDFECRMRRKDGSIFWARYDGRFTKTADGTPCFQGFIIDITDRKEAEEEISKLNVELEQRVIDRTTQLEAANEELEAFSYSVSHDLRSPLRAIDGFSNILLKEHTDKLDAEGLRLLNVIRTSTKHMDQLITDLLALSRVSMIELTFSRIDMTKMAHFIYHEIVPPEVQRKFAFFVTPLPDSNGDLVLLRQVWSNLVANAVKFTLLRDERRIEISGYTEKDMNIYSIRDTGVGFNPNYTHKLFGVFQRLHKSSEFEGNGVGLAIIQRIVHRHGGRVWAEGKINEGATFFFSLPIKEIKNEPHE
jgi:PAS domain S-box-containing protein